MRLFASQRSVLPKTAVFAVEIDILFAVEFDPRKPNDLAPLSINPDPPTIVVPGAEVPIVSDWPPRIAEPKELFPI